MDDQKVPILEFETDDFQRDPMLIRTKKDDSVRRLQVWREQRAATMLDDESRSLSADRVSSG